jgi:UDP-N-acetylglucosamine 2-epimerase
MKAPTVSDTQVLDPFAIRPDFSVNLTRSGQDLGEVNSNALSGGRAVHRQSAPS